MNKKIEAIEDIQYDKTNRMKSKQSKKSLFWCSGCDANKVGQYGKCSNCGYIENKNKLKKY